MVRKGEVLETDAVSEVGVYGTFLRRGDQVLLNEEAGHLVRTKVGYYTSARAALRTP